MKPQVPSLDIAAFPYFNRCSAVFKSKAGGPYSKSEIETECNSSTRGANEDPGVPCFKISQSRLDLTEK